MCYLQEFLVSYTLLPVLKLLLNFDCDCVNLGHICRIYPPPLIGATWRVKFKTKKILARWSSWLSNSLRNLTKSYARLHPRLRRSARENNVVRFQKSSRERS